MTENEKLKYIKDAYKDGKIAVKVVMKNLFSDKYNGKTFYFQYIDNSWKAQSFVLKYALKTIVEFFDIVDEDVQELKREEAMKLLGYSDEC